MFSVFVPTESSLKKAVIEDLARLPDSAGWIDLVNPSTAEDRAVERLAGIAVPTREDMQEIEISSRLYIENGARYMTATLMCNSDSDMPRTTAVTFILAGHRLVTVRYDGPKPFALVENKLGRRRPPRGGPSSPPLPGGSPCARPSRSRSRWSRTSWRAPARPRSRARWC